jgi:hypothetical protein
MKFVAGTFTILVLSLGRWVAGDFSIFTGSPSGSILACGNSIEGPDICACLSGTGDVEVTGTSNIQTSTTFTVQPGLCGNGQLDGYQSSSNPSNWDIYIHDAPTPSLVAGCVMPNTPYTCSETTYNLALLCISENPPSAEVCAP